MRLSMMMTNRTKLAGAMLVLAVASVSAQTYPSHQITNGEITATVYLPDAKNGFYKTTRFDWSGAIGSLKYKGHDYYGTWWSKITDIYDFGYEGPKQGCHLCRFHGDGRARRRVRGAWATTTCRQVACSSSPASAS